MYKSGLRPMKRRKGRIIQSSELAEPPHHSGLPPTLNPPLVWSKPVVSLSRLGFRVGHCLGRLGRLSACLFQSVHCKMATLFFSIELLLHVIIPQRFKGKRSLQSGGLLLGLGLVTPALEPPLPPIVSDRDLLNGEAAVQLCGS